MKNDKLAITVVAEAAKGLFDKVEYSKPSFAGEDFC